MADGAVGGRDGVQVSAKLAYLALAEWRQGGRIGAVLGEIEAMAKPLFGLGTLFSDGLGESRPARRPPPLSFGALSGS